MVLIACSRNPYKATNKVYKKQARTYAKQVAKMPVEDSVSNAPFFVGTTNFSLRKPNYVIGSGFLFANAKNIYTDQNSSKRALCDLS
jgi:hypothetical protein